MRVTILLLVLAATVLGGEERAADELLVALSSSNYQVRRKAVLAVEGRTEPALLDRVLTIAVSDSNPNIRGYAAVVIASFDDERVFPVLAKMATSEQDVGPRQQAYVALGKLKDPRGWKILLAGLEAERGTRGYAAKGLGLLGYRDAFAPVSRLLLKHADDPYVAEMAPEALEKIRTPEALVFLREHFIALPSHARIAAARVLGRHPDQKTRELMVGLLASEDRGVRYPAIGVLGDLGDTEATQALLGVFAREPGDRALVAHALGKIGDRRAVDPLTAALSLPPAGPAKLRIIEALGRIGDPVAIDALIPLLDDTTFVPQSPDVSAIRGYPYNVRISGAAVWAVLTLRNGKEPFPIADLSVFPDGRPPERIAGDVAALRKWAAREKPKPFRAADFPTIAARVPYFEKRINSRNPRERRRALLEAFYLRDAGDEEAVRFLRRLFLDADPRVRGQAIRKLYDSWIEVEPSALPATFTGYTTTRFIDVENPECRRRLHARLSDSGPDAGWAAYALHLLGDDSATPKLKALARHRNMFVRQTAARALLAFGEKKAAAAIFLKLADPGGNAWYAIQACRGLVSMGAGHEDRGHGSLLVLWERLELSTGANDVNSITALQMTLARITGRYFHRPEEYREYLGQTKSK